jgi:thiol:disulfide interchange protein DsbC
MQRRAFVLCIAAALASRAHAQTQRVDFDSLPLDHAIRIVHGKGTRRIVVFEDPYCPFCRKLEQTLSSLDDVVIYVLLFPILTPDSRAMAEAIWCAPDRSAAWREWMMQGIAPPASFRACDDSPVAGNLALAARLGVRITPSIVFPGGELVTGALPLDDIEGILDGTRQ